jgi:hypothetical protein
MSIAGASAQPFSIDDIEFWVGSGAKSAALVIDWVEDSTDAPALAWGYRWDGMAKGSDMLSAVVSADPRLVARLGGTPGNPNAVYGLGYDADNDNNDKEFQFDDFTAPFDADGFFYSGPADGSSALDSSDYYAEGWFAGFWHYGIASSNPYDGGSWSDTPAGMAGRTLVDGAWDSWAFTPTFDFSAFAENPVAALPPDLPGDFNDDGEVNQADFNLWRSTFGSTSELAADANDNGVVDAADYVVWRKFSSDPMIAAANSQSAPSRATAPEPAAFWLAALSLCVPVLLLPRKREEIL